MPAVIPGIENFSGRVVHPQFWPEDLDYADKKIAVIGSGATAVTLIPALAKIAEKVTMVQRSPSYVVAFPNRVRPKTWWERILPMWLQHKITRIRFLIGGFLYRRYLSGDSEKMKEFLAKITQAQLPKHIPYDPHFKPKYKPWTQRVCLCPDGDFFKAMHKGNVDVTTGIISIVTPSGITMEDGSSVDADIIVTATGLNMKYGGNADIYVDGEELKWGEKFLWRGVMIQDVPNMALVMGYTKASWTLGADATATMVCRMLKHLNSNNLTSATPRIPTTEDKEGQKEMVKLTSASGVMGLTSTYITTAIHRLPKTSDDKPWKARGSYLEDMWDARWASLSRGMQFVQKARV
jgi:cation diffusion facilitator CzcD-associated flavoprotein CzcO